ncbi:MAG TPA: ATP-binding cassette domain-containing protein [Streptosporangiaceae bacterium]|jgi:ABC-type lipoprotein export system ATPase subunit|nr:ATP-binding cassette domain-containing protein [Streptosporangiaceae bacterium]
MTAPSEAAELIRCTGLSRTYGSGSVPAVREASCTLRAGMQVALTGPSGSGKSTLLHLMAGLDTPTSGTIAWPGLDGSPFARPGVVGLVFQGPSLLPPLDVTENIALPLLLAGYAETQARERAGAALHQVGLDELAARLPEELSGGQAQRVAVARALAARPNVILADEPTGQLDSAHAAQVAELLLTAVAQFGAALVLATHDLTLADRLPVRWEMAGGILVTEGSYQC